MTPVDPRTPVIVGVGQINVAGGDVPEPVDLLAEAACRAAEDAGARRLLSAVESIRVVRILSWGYTNAGRLLAERLRLPAAHTAVTTDGGHHPQTLVDRTANDIRRGDLDVALIGGAEALRTRARLRARGERAPWTTQPSGPAPDDVIGAPLAVFCPEESRLGLSLPVEVYPLFESALRLRAGWSAAEHRHRLGRLWAGFSAVAAGNPHAALPAALAPEEIAEPADGNRMVAFPYTKRLCANNHVDQAAALILCSAERARALGVAPDRFVFPYSGAEASDTTFVSHRSDLTSSPALRRAGDEAFRLAGVGPGDLDTVDLYSCFPSAVQVAARALELDLNRPLTVTGGLTFAGGPGNNAATHAIAALVGRLRRHPDTYGLCTAIGGLLTKHAVGVYAATPPRHPFRHARLGVVMEPAGERSLSAGYSGPGRLEAFTVLHGRDGRPATAYVAARLPDGSRAWARSHDADVLTWLTGDDVTAAPLRLTVAAGSAPTFFL